MSIPSSQIAGIALEKPADLSSRKIQEKLSSSAIVGFFRLAELWKLRDEDARGLLGGISNGSYYSLKKHPAKMLDQDKLTRISLLLGLFNESGTLQHVGVCASFTNKKRGELVEFLAPRTPLA